MTQPVCLVYNISYVIYHSMRHFGTVSLTSVLICPCIQHHGFCSSWSTTYHLSPMSSLLLEYLHVLGSMPTLHLQKKVTFKFVGHCQIQILKNKLLFLPSIVLSVSFSLSWQPLHWCIEDFFLKFHELMHIQKHLWTNFNQSHCYRWTIINGHCLLFLILLSLSLIDLTCRVKIETQGLESSQMGYLFFKL